MPEAGWPRHAEWVNNHSKRRRFPKRQAACAHPHINTQVKKRTHLPQPEAQGKQRPPKTFVFWRGKHGVGPGGACPSCPALTLLLPACMTRWCVQLILKSLESDLRKVMSPNTASHLKVSPFQTAPDTTKHA